MAPKHPETEQTTAPSETTLAQRVMQERLNIAYESMSRLFRAVFLAVLVVAAVVWTPGNVEQVSLWCIVTLLVAVLRLELLRRFRKMTREEREERASWLHWQYVIGAALGGLSWGLLAVLVWDPANASLQVLIVLAVVGMCSGSIVTLAAFGEASSAFIAIAMGLLMGRFLVEGGPESAAMVALGTVYIVLVGSYALRANRTLVEGLEMKLLRGEAEEKIRRQALYDELTGLPNRRLFQDRLRQTLSRVKRHNQTAALLFLDLDFFKRVNDSLGHSVGDELLVEIARRMRSLLREEDTAARLGGDEFVALITELEEDSQGLATVVQRRAEELRREIEKPANIRGNEIHITVSIGISMLDASVSDTEDLLSHADTAMYRAKEDGRNQVRFFASEMQHALAHRVKLENALRVAIEEKRGLSLYLQPQYDVQMDLCGVELLLRWEHDGSFIPPDEFIPIAEDCGLIYPLGDWVIGEACAIGARLHPLMAARDFSVALNVSPRQFRSKGFIDTVLRAIERHQVPAGLMELEVTEGLLIEDVDDTVEKISALRDRGVRFSIDDFGTGYSSLSYLKSLPLDTLKIDQSFVRDVLTDPGDASIVRAIVSMAATLDLEVIAEGVETEDVHRFLVDAGCGRFQGYLYNRPMPFEKFIAQLAQDDATIVGLNAR